MSGDAKKLVEELLSEEPVVVCYMCDQEFGPQQFPPETKLSHGLCRRHGREYLISQAHVPPEEADAILARMTAPGAPDRAKEQKQA